MEWRFTLSGFLRLLELMGRTQPMRPFHSTKLKEAYDVHHRRLLQTKENPAFPLVIICFDFEPQFLLWTKSLLPNKSQRAPTKENRGTIFLHVEISRSSLKLKSPLSNKSADGVVFSSPSFCEWPSPLGFTHCRA